MHRYIHDSGWGLELKRKVGQGENTGVSNIAGTVEHKPKNSAKHSIQEFFLERAILTM